MRSAPCWQTSGGGLSQGLSDRSTCRSSYSTWSAPKPQGRRVSWLQERSAVCSRRNPLMPGQRAVSWLCWTSSTRRSWQAVKEPGRQPSRFLDMSTTWSFRRRSNRSGRTARRLSGARRTSSASRNSRPRPSDSNGPVMDCSERIRSRTQSPTASLSVLRPQLSSHSSSAFVIPRISSGRPFSCSLPWRRTTRAPKAGTSWLWSERMLRRRKSRQPVYCEALSRPR
mmetsp:Transcript_88982/g.237304  ORF Transcript_88982/g.237304 Transcript_88982/m.237304 type:complete len:226 (-) Transcript_88982:822-1499(-)